jgi:penicillin-binding protein 1C
VATRAQRWKRRVRRCAIGAAAGAGLLAGAFFVLDRLYPLDLSRAGEASVVVVDREGRMLRAFTTPAGTWRLAAKPDEVSPLYVQMLLAYEDRRFRSHPGVDPVAVARAAWQWAWNGRIVSGGSTLSMQVARLLEPEKRSLGAKFTQAFRALQLELALSKDEILALYLARAPYGGNLEGVRAASLAWFGKEPRHLTAGEAALLIALPQSPAATRPDRRPEAAKRARDKILTVLEQRGVIAPAMAAEARAEPIPRLRRPLPLLAPHATADLRDRAPKSLLRLESTLDAKLQETMEALARSELSGIAQESNIAILVADHATGAIRAYVGSADFFDARRQGQVDMVRAIRSPGSTLKPFVYGLGFDLGLVHPETIVTDGPTRFGDYRPENFQRHYMGEVSVRVALQQSLNVPAVSVLDAVGPERFTGLLRAAGITMRFETAAERPGLPVALGGVGTSLADLVTLYAALGNRGLARPLRLETSYTPAPDGKRIVSAGAAWHLARILESAPPPNDTLPRAFLNRPFDIAYKTGTSYGFRDAWAIGYDGKHVIGVWVGRPDGTPSPDRYGRVTALPILFKAFDLVPETRNGSAGRAMPDRPSDAHVSANERLPRTLRRFAPRHQRMATATPDRPAPAALAISFPPANATVGLEKKGDTDPHLFLVAEGGAKPLRWIVNGQPVEARPGGQVFWRVDGEGFVRVTVIDADGRTASVQARIKIY